MPVFRRKCACTCVCVCVCARVYIYIVYVKHKGRLFLARYEGIWESGGIAPVILSFTISISIGQIVASLDEGTVNPIIDVVSRRKFIFRSPSEGQYTDAKYCLGYELRDQLNKTYQYFKI